MEVPYYFKFSKHPLHDQYALYAYKKPIIALNMIISFEIS